MNKPPLLLIVLLASVIGCAHDPFPPPPADRPIRTVRGDGLDCSRNAPRALLKKKQGSVLSTRFQRISPQEGRETARLKGNVRLTIFHRGCTRTGYTFRFQLFGPDRPLHQRRYWYTRAARLVSALGQANLNDLSQRLTRAALNPPAYGRQLRMGEYQRLSLQMKKERRGPIIELTYDFRL